MTKADLKEIYDLSNDDEKLYEPHAAVYLGVGRSTLRRTRDERRIGYHRWNGKVYYSIRQMNDYQNRHEVKPIRDFGKLRMVK